MYQLVKPASQEEQWERLFHLVLLGQGVLASVTYGQKNADHPGW